MIPFDLAALAPLTWATVGWLVVLRLTRRRDHAATGQTPRRSGRADELRPAA